LLFDMQAVFGVSEKDKYDLAKQHPGIVAAIKSYLWQHKITDRHVIMPVIEGNN